MEIYHIRARWLSCFFIVPAVWLTLSIFGFTAFTISPNDVMGVSIVIAICTIVGLQCFFGSTRFYFDNPSQTARQVRSHFYGSKTLATPYRNIEAISVRRYQRNTNLLIEVGLIEKTELLGQPATRFTPLRSYGGKENSLSDAITLAKAICSYTSLPFADDSKLIRKEISSSSNFFN